MDLASILFADGLALTGAKFESEFAKITGHQLTALDMAEDYNWGVDLPLGGFGILSCRHLNGHLLDARYFLDGDDSEAIQAAVDFAAATSEASGIVWIPEKGSAYSITTTIAVPDRVTIVGDPHRTRLSLDAGTTMFSVTGSNVRIENFDIDGNSRTADAIVLTAGENRLTVRNISMGLSGDLDGFLLSGGGALSVYVHVEDCRIAVGVGLVDLTAPNSVVERCSVVATAASSDPVSIRFSDSDHVVIRNNYLYGHDGTNPGDRAIHLDNCDYAVIENNETFGYALSTVRVTDCNYGVIRNNRFLNGATAGTTNDGAILWVEHCSDLQVHDNIITGVTDLVGTIPINMEYCMATGDGAGYGTAGSHILVFNNVFSAHEDRSTPPGGYYRSASPTGVINGFSGVYRRWGNTFSQDQAGTAVISGGATTEGLTGLAIDTSWAARIQVTGTAQAIGCSSIDDGGFTVITFDGAAGTNLVAGNARYSVDG